MQQEVTILEIDWSESLGATGSVGLPTLFGWLRASYVRPGLIEDGRVVVLARSAQREWWDQYQGPVSLTEADTLVNALGLLGIPERAPRIEPLYDGSEIWRTVGVRVVVNGRVQAFGVEMQSGIGGEDADGLRAVFRRILELCGAGELQTNLGPRAGE